MKIKPIYWELLLKIKEIYKTVDCRFESISISKDFKPIKNTNESLYSDEIAIIRFYPKKTEANQFYDVAFSDVFPKKLKKIFLLYLGYILVNRNAKTPFTCVHIAQTLDGKIATPTGKSKWIGNKDNLIHAHRIRALVDAILIGGNTFRIDEPRLNVRLVKGENPIKIIVANSKLKLENLSRGKTYLMCNTLLEYDELPEETEIVHVDNHECWIDSKTLLKELKKRDIHSILIEGGAQTIRKFIEEKTLSRIEFHIAPIIFGSGLNGIELEAIDDLESAIHLKNPQHFKIGNAIMTISNLPQNDN
jgi:diaminohydroxyphosphoribosylaminopyrimidine deaminase/5-amino-6-(5-phosphoribosylamino)uracil reductase